MTSARCWRKRKIQSASPLWFWWWKWANKRRSGPASGVLRCERLRAARVRELRQRALRNPTYVEKFDGPGIEQIELLNIRIRIEIHTQFKNSCQNSSEIQKFEDLSTCSKLFLEILKKFHWNWCKIENSTKIAKKSRFLLKLISAKIWKSLTKICEDFELRAVQRCGNLVDLEKRCKMSIWTQKSALIQLRTSLLKFGDLAENFENSSVSNFSTKTESTPCCSVTRLWSLRSGPTVVGFPPPPRGTEKALLGAWPLEQLDRG